MEDRLFALTEDILDFLTYVVPQERGEPQLLKLIEEVEEMHAQPSLDEGADILIILLGWVVKAGFTSGMLLSTAERKMAINRRRTWVELPDGTWHHTKEENAYSSTRSAASQDWDDLVSQHSD